MVEPELIRARLSVRRETHHSYFILVSRYKLSLPKQAQPATPPTAHSWSIYMGKTPPSPTIENPPIPPILAPSESATWRVVITQIYSLVIPAHVTLCARDKEGKGSGRRDYRYLDEPIYGDCRLVLSLHTGVTQLLLTTQALPQVCWPAASAYASLVPYRTSLSTIDKGTTKKNVSAAGI